MTKREFPKTLNSVWKECLRMWKYITKTRDSDATLPYITLSANIAYLKEKWLKNEGYDYKRIQHGCFFCEWDLRHNAGDCYCTFCPGKIVNKRFGCCDLSYHHVCGSHKFYKKLLELDKKRKEK